MTAENTENTENTETTEVTETTDTTEEVQCTQVKLGIAYDTLFEFQNNLKTETPTVDPGCTEYQREIIETLANIDLLEQIVDPDKKTTEIIGLLNAKVNILHCVIGNLNLGVTLTQQNAPSGIRKTLYGVFGISDSASKSNPFVTDPKIKTAQTEYEYYKNLLELARSFVYDLLNLDMTE